MGVLLLSHYYNIADSSSRLHCNNTIDCASNRYICFQLEAEFLLRVELVDCIYRKWGYKLGSDKQKKRKRLLRGGGIGDKSFDLPFQFNV